MRSDELRRRRLAAILILAFALACNDPAGPPKQPKPADTFIAVAAGFDRTCAVTGDHRVFCWVERAADPVQVMTPESLTTIAGAPGLFGNHFCGQTATGSMYCWGVLLQLDLGAGIYDGVYGPVKIGDGYLPGSATVASGHACALAADSTAWCWGSYFSAKRGVPQGNHVADSIPNLVNSDHFSRLAAGHSHTCGIRGNGSVACWGDSASLAAPANAYLHGNDDCWEAIACSPTPLPVQSISGGYDIVSGFIHTCALAANGLWCWGSNHAGQLGRPGLHAGIVAVPVTLPVTPVSVTTGDAHTCALSADGAAYCWGDNQRGQFGAGFSGTGQAPTRVRFNGQFAQLSAGSGQTCGIDTRGRLYCWGNDSDFSSVPWHGNVPVRVRAPD